MRFALPAVIATLLLAGCVAPVTSLQTTAIESEGTVKAPPVARVELKGVAMAPANILSANTSSLVGNNAAGLIADKGGSLAAPTYGLLALEALAPVAGAEVELQDATGKPLAGVEAVKTDAQGAFTLKNVPAGITWVVEVKGAAFHLTTLAAGQTGPVAPIEVTPSTTVVTEHLRQSFSQDRTALRQVKPDEFAELTRAVGAAIDHDGLAVDLAPAGKAAEVLAAVASKDGAIGQEVKGIVQAANEARKAEKEKEKAPGARPSDAPVGQAGDPAPADPAASPAAEGGPGNSGGHADEHAAPGAGGHAPNH